MKCPIILLLCLTISVLHSAECMTPDLIASGMRMSMAMKNSMGSMNHSSEDRRAKRHAQDDDYYGDEEDEDFGFDEGEMVGDEDPSRRFSFLADTLLSHMFAQSKEKTNAAMLTALNLFRVTLSGFSEILANSAEILQNHADSKQS